MKKQILILTCSFLLSSSLMQGQPTKGFDYEKQWKTVNEKVDKERPESALEIVELIYQEAKRTNNFAELVKASGHKIGLQYTIDNSSAPELIADFETLCNENDFCPEEQAILYSLLAELYAQYYDSNEYAIRQRTPLIGDTPADITLWSPNNFYDKITAELDRSLADTGLLARTNLKGYASLLQPLDKKHALPSPQNALLDLLIKRAIHTLNITRRTHPTRNPLNDSSLFAPVEKFVQLPIDSVYTGSTENRIITWYQTLLQSHLQQGDTALIIFDDLERLDYLRRNSQNTQASEHYIQALEQMRQAYRANEYIVEVLDRLAEYYYEQARWGQYSDNPDIKRKAYDLCTEGIQAYPQYPRIGMLKNQQALIGQKSISVESREVVAPGTEIKLELTTENIHQVQIDIYRVDADAETYYKDKRHNDPYPKRHRVHSESIAVACDTNFNATKQVVSIPVGTFGIYEYELYDKSFKETEKAVGSFTVSNFTYLNRRSSIKENRIYVLDRVSGEPVADVAVNYYRTDWKRNKSIPIFIGSATTDANGLCLIQTEESPFLVFQKGEDRYFCNKNYYNYYPEQQNPANPVELAILTDRSIYRPGQTVHFKAIAFQRQTQNVATDQAFEVKLRDANHKEINKATFRTNEFGSFSGEFILPANGMNGQYCLESEAGSFYFRVEEYKRPTFEIVIDKPKEETAFGHPLTFTGTIRTYAGNRPDNARLSYRIIRRTHYWFAWRGLPDQTVADGTLTADTDGRFEATFTPEKERNNRTSFPEQCYTYTLEVTATDSKGETQTGTQSVSVGDQSLFIRTDLPSHIDKAETINIPVSTETLNGAEAESELRYTLSLLKTTDDYAEMSPEGPKSEIDRQVLSGTIHTRGKALRLDLAGQPSGAYRLSLSTTDSQGRPVTSENDFILYGQDDQRPPIQTYAWLTDYEVECMPGQTASVRFGTSADQVHLLYEVIRKDYTTEAQWLVLNNEIRTFSLPFTPEDGDEINMRFTFVKDGRMFTRQVAIKKKQADKKLSLKWNVFRDKLRPGDTAEWSAVLATPEGTHPVGEVLASMYDASLDAIYPHSWAFAPDYQPAYRHITGWSGRGLGKEYSQNSNKLDFEQIKYFNPTIIAWNGLQYISRKRNHILVYEELDTEMADTYYDTKGAIVMMGGKELKNPTPPPPPSESIRFKSQEVIPLGYTPNTKEGNGTAQTAPALRQNFNETAFFYPQLRTDSEGNVHFSFTAPESLTRWNVRLLAHTPDLHYAQLEAQTLTQKELMAQLNLPRFVRRSDRVVLSAQVSNLTDAPLNPTVSLQLIDPATEKPLKIKTLTPRKLTLSAQETKAVEWEVGELPALDLLIVRLVADAGTFSDGEQRYLPVLPDQVLITESLPLTVHGSEKQTFRFDRLLNMVGNLRSQSLTVEMATNPVWYAVLALPSLGTPTGENAIDYYTAFYSASLATHIVRTYPKIAEIFDRWKLAEGSKDALLSNLEKNSELKNVLLEETPWVLEASDETEQRQRIALLFDLNQQKNRADEYLAKLIALQQPDGGFAWFKGMGSNRYITQTILLGIGRYGRLTGHDLSHEPWVRKALAYIDSLIADDYEYTKEKIAGYKNEMSIDNIQWFYLHVRSEFPTADMDSVTREALDFYTRQAYRYWTKATLYGRSTTALIARRNGEVQTADDIMASLREYALHSPDMGMYWNTPDMRLYWNERPVFLQTALLDVFSECGATSQELDEMKLWLLRQKQTQRWDSPIATAEAVYALLNYDNNRLANENQATVKLGNRTLAPSAQEAGTGYFKESIAPNEVRPNMGRITVEKQGEGMAWGAVYWQYWLDIDRTESHGAGLSIEKRLYVERMENGSPMLYPVSATEVKRGDRVITRLEIKADRNMEYVALKDLRASGLEPAEYLSGYEWKGGAGYYRTTRDNSTQFFFDYLPKGSYVLEYASWANNAGDFTDGMASIQCLYAPEFTAHSTGGRLIIKKQ